MSKPEHHASEKVRLREKIENARKRGGRRLLELLRHATALDDTDALVELGRHYQDGLKDSAGRDVVRRSEGPALKCFRRAAQLGDTNGMILLATSLERLALKQKPSARSSRRFAGQSRRPLPAPSRYLALSPWW